MQAVPHPSEALLSVSLTPEQADLALIALYALVQGSKAGPV